MQVLEGAIQNSIGMKLVLIPAGEFVMGSPDSEEGRSDDEGPQHKVEIRNAFYLGKYEVTRAQFRQFVEEKGYKTEAERIRATKLMGAILRVAPLLGWPTGTWQNAGDFQQTDEHPVVYVSWNDAKAFCDWLSKKEGKQYRLPREAEWEYSCRARTGTRFHSGDGADSLKRVARFGLKVSDGTAPVGRLEPNKFGLYDMHGNVWEWCEDWYDRNYYRDSPAQDPQGPKAGSLRVFRGGSFYYSPCSCRAANRLRYGPADRNYDVGFRVVLVR